MGRRGIFGASKYRSIKKKMVHILKIKKDKNKIKYKIRNKGTQHIWLNGRLFRTFLSFFFEIE